MKLPQKITLTALIVLVLASLASVLLTRPWADYRKRLRAERQNAQQDRLVSTRPLDTAQQIAPLAVTHSEQQDADEALRLGDRSVDMAFAAALEDAAENPAPLTKETRQLAARIKSLEDANAADNQHITDLKNQLAKARPNQKDAVQDQLDIAQAQSALDQDDLADAHEDFIRAGGDKQATIQQELDKHEASEAHQETSKPGSYPTIQAPTATSASANSGLELTKSRSILAEARAALSLNSKAQLLQQARSDALADAETLSAAHDSLEKRLSEEKAQKKIIPAPGASNPAFPSETASPGASSSAPPAPQSALSVLKQMQLDQKNLAALDKRIETEQQLAATYGNWLALVIAREKSFLHGIFVDLFWILVIVLLVFITNEWIRGVFSKLSQERRDLHAMSTILVLAIQAVGLVLILLVIFSTPTNFGTVVALAGAGLTVAMKDFIMGFIGWFFLMGKDGIRPGDWVEIGGISGEVIEIGPIHTVLLETGKWADAAHPTGRKVSLLNSYAIEGQYFNFSASGQWLWDEISLQVGQDSDPFRIAEAVKKIVADATAPNAREAEEAWSRVVPKFAQRNFSAEPSISLTTSGSGINILVRYIARVRDRQQIRARIYRDIVELLHQKHLPDTTSVGDTSAPDLVRKSK
jgi:small-conductance mechanosensitive channel